MKKMFVTREIPLYLLLFLSSVLLIFLPFFWNTLFACFFDRLFSGSRVIPLLRYGFNTLIMTGAFPMAGFLAIAARRSKLFGMLAAVVVFAGYLFLVIPDFPPVFSFAQVWAVLKILFPVYLTLLLCLGAALLCRKVKSDLPAFLIPVGIAFLSALVSYVLNSLFLQKLLPAGLLVFLLGVVFVLIQYPICLLLKKWLMPNEPTCALPV